MQSHRSDLIDIACAVRRDLGASILIADGSEDDNGNEKLTCLPKSQVEINDDGTVTMPEWLAKDRGLI